MITKDFDIIKEIFSIIDNGIIEGYDSFNFEVKVEVGYIDTQLTVERNGTVTTDAKTDINDAVLYALVKRLRESAAQRGECWASFVISYRIGEQVKTNFKYSK
ncbi:hypothetical protein PQU63_11690 [Xanthomonas protegens]|uniref:Uncharacterized protein n=1 Tax=Xanthomonas protegens TaxID=3380705 RepID=A0ABU9LD78_9XANT